MKKFISLFLVVSILALSVPLTAQEKKGADLIIQRIDGNQVRGELIAVKQNSLLLLERDSGADVTVDNEDIRVITRVKESKVWEGMGFGLLIGGGAGALVSGIVVESGYATSGLIVIVSGVLAAVLGLIIGGYIGAASGEDKTIQIEGRTDSEIQEILEKLRKRARVKNYQ